MSTFIPWSLPFHDHPIKAVIEFHHTSFFLFFNRFSGCGISLHTLLLLLGFPIPFKLLLLVYSSWFFPIPWSPSFHDHHHTMITFIPWSPSPIVMCWYIVCRRVGRIFKGWFSNTKSKTTLPLKKNHTHHSEIHISKNKTINSHILYPYATVFTWKFIVH